MPAGEPPHPCGRDAYRKTDSTARWLDDQPGPSRCQSSRQGYCSYCRVIYSNLDQHISSSRHRESVRVSSRASSVVSSVSSLMERFLQDVIHHHPHRYNDTRPPHEDLPSLSCPLMPREELAELCPSNEDSHSLGTRDELSSSEGTSCHIACQQEVDVVTTADDGGQSEDRTVLEAGPGRPSPPIAQYLETHAHPAERDAHTVHGHTHAPGARSPPSVHRKAHRKSNRRRERASSSSSSLPTLTQLCSPPRGQLPSSRPQLCPTPSVRQLPSSGPQPASSGPQPASSVPQPASSGPHPPSSVPCPASSDPQFTCTPRAPQLSSRGPQLSSSSPQPFASGPKPSSSSPHPACSGPQSASVGLQLLSSSSPQLSSRGLQLSSTPRDPQLSSINRQLTSSGPQLYSTPRAPPLSSHGPQPPSSSPQPCSIGPHLAPQPSREALAWTAWQSERRKVQKDEAFSGDQTELIEDTIEKVIQTCAHGHSPPGDLQRDAESFHFSLPDSLRTDSEDWDTPVQEVLDAPALAASEAHAPILVELSCLTQRKVELEDHLYSTQLDSALHTRLAREEVEEQEVEEGGGWYRDLPIEAVLPAPPHIPESFRGKSWALIEQEDQRKVEDLVRQFRWERFISYFDSDSMARYGRRRSQNKKNRGLNKEAEAEHHILPLLDHNDDDDDPVCIRRKRKRRAFRLASRCQVVKVSHATQTVPLVVPSVRQTPATPATPKTTNQEMGPSPEEEDGEGRIPDLQSMLGSLRLPASYAHLVTPLQARTSVVYLLCSPSPTPPPPPPAASSASPKRCRKRRRPLDRGVQGLKVTYKRVALRLYDPSSNRILRSTPRGCSSITLQGASRGANKRPHSVVRQLFKNLSPQQNSEGPAGGRGRKRSKRSEALSAGRSGQDSPPGVRVQGEPSLGDGNRRPLCTLSTDSSKDAALGKRGRRRKGGGEVERSDQQADVKKMRRRTVARSQGREPSSSARPRKGGGRQRADGGKVQGSRGPVEVPPAGHEEEKAQPYSRRLRARKRTGCLCCKS